MRSETRHTGPFLVTSLMALGWVAVASAQPASPPDRTRDRGPGIPTSMFATYIERGELIVYPFFEHYRDRNAEYRPSEFGYSGDQEYRGRYRASEGLLFLGYGLADNVALEFEASTTHAALERAPQDGSGMPARIVESGLGDVEGQVRWRWKRETSTRPEISATPNWSSPMAVRST